MTMRQRQPELPDLRIVPVSDLLLHEQHDAQRSEPLVQRLRADGVLKNPPIVARIGSEQRYVVLDGANRVTGLEAATGSASGLEALMRRDIDRYRRIIVLTGAKPE